MVALTELQLSSQNRVSDHPRKVEQNVSRLDFNFPSETTSYVIETKDKRINKNMNQTYIKPIFENCYFCPV